MKHPVAGRVLYACSALSVVALGVTGAKAGGFALREQSTYGQGSAFAGVAAGGSLSSMFWNPATITQSPGLNTESDLTGILPYATNSVAPASTLAVLGGTGNTGSSALLPASYYSWQFNPNWWLGLSVTSPFGLSTTFPDVWAGRGYAQNTSLRSYNATPTVAVRLNDWISFGLGVQVQYATADLNSGIGATAGNHLSVNGNGWGFGFTAGATLTPAPGTQIGLGWRSGLDQKISGTLDVIPVGLPATTPGAVNTTVRLPDIFSLGLRQRINNSFTLLATAEWSHWSRIGTAVINQSSGAPATVGGQPVRLPFEYKDGWFGSIGGEYVYSPSTMLRAGIGYEVSPITDQVRTPRLPDNNRVWLSVGATYALAPSWTVDFAYSHIFVKDTHIDISAASGNPWFNGVTYIGDVSSRVDIISVGIKYKWQPDPVAPARPAKALVRKG
jgi:long-chain fatty acid transport protein